MVGEKILTRKYEHSSPPSYHAEYPPSSGLCFRTSSKKMDYILVNMNVESIFFYVVGVACAFYTFPVLFEDEFIKMAYFWVQCLHVLFHHVFQPATKWATSEGLAHHLEEPKVGPHHHRHCPRHSQARALQDSALTSFQVRLSTPNFLTAWKKIFMRNTLTSALLYPLTHLFPGFYF